MLILKILKLIILFFFFLIRKSYARLKFFKIKMNFETFVFKLLDFLDDAMPEIVIREKAIMQRIFQIIRHEDTKQNKILLPILRKWCRCAAVRISIERDKRLSIGPYSDIQKSFAPICQMFVDKLIPFFKNPKLLPLVIETVSDLLTIGNIPASPALVDIAMNSMTGKERKPLVIPLLNIVSKANFKVDGLPLLDPMIAKGFPELHQKLSLIAPDDFKEQITKINRIVSKIDKINNCEDEVDRDFLEFCDVSKLVTCSPPDVFVTHPNPQVRKTFYKYALEKKLDIHPFLESLLHHGIFDPEVKEYALALLSMKLPTLIEPPLPDQLLAYVQCIPMEKNGAIFNAIVDIIEGTDNFTYICSCIRFLYHKEDWVRDTIKKVLQATLQVSTFPDVLKQPQNDFYVEKFMKNLKKQSPVTESQIANNLLEIILSPEQPLDIKQVSSKSLAEMLLDPYCDVRSILPSLYTLSYEDFPELMHALAIRDGNFKINDHKKLFHLVQTINDKNALHLLPILTRAVFASLLYVESDGANLLRIPLFLEDQFIIKGSGGVYRPSSYQPVKEFPLSKIVKEWIDTKIIQNRPINDIFFKHKFYKFIVCNKRLGSDILTHIDAEDSAAAKLATSCPPKKFLTFLLLSVLDAKRASTAASSICEKYMNEMPMGAMKLAQVLIEYGGECKLPENICEYIVDPKYCRTALSLVVTAMRFKKEVNNIDFEKLETLIKYLEEERLPINVKRQLSALLLLKEKSDLSLKFAESSDAITKSFGFHTAIPNSESAALALSVASQETEAICARAAALELFTDYCRTNPPPSDNLAALYHTSTGETIFSLQLLKMLQIPSIRAQVSKANEFILSFLDSKCPPLYVNCALQCLLGIDFDDAKIAVALSELLPIKQYTDNVLQVLATTPDKSLNYFTSDIHQIICSTFAYDCDLNLAFVCINHLLLAGIPFPSCSVKILINLYQSFLEASCCSSALHTILPQIFNASTDAKEIALENGFPDLLYSELTVSRENKVHFNCVILTAAEFVFGFKEGQLALVKSWQLDTLIDIFQPTSEVLHFFLCLTSRNVEIETMYATEIGTGSLLKLLLEAFNSVHIQTPQVIQLLACILHSDVIRRVIYRKKKVKTFVSRLFKYVSMKNWKFAESLIRLFAVLTFYSDGIDNLLDSTHIAEMLEILMENDEIIQMDIFRILATNIKGHTRTWAGVQQSFKKHNKQLYEVFMEIVADQD
ncbi:hypothetical protein TRFO_06876 [Tritrichomonas foetus]|uniref:Uncharacterized protein n=1 Tax=Tritrichomonas foetus TaxID=1144522 RepID=A0A1J4JW01_9EUKA|nr:hypothetical protein TRFO_06876 [Tritrichomonas foetus]|eukprot:OHT03187.1 hypothetical protein TRFO_06876 [Tritrichomonas foetus]